MIKTIIAMAIVSCWIINVSAQKNQNYDSGRESLLQHSKLDSMENIVTGALQFSFEQSLKLAESLKDQKGLLPKNADRFGKLQTCDSGWWTSGFFPGILWYMYEYSKDDNIRKLADEFSQRVAGQQYNTGTHDIGFMIFCSYGNGYRLTKNSVYESIILNAANSLITRFNSKTGAIQSWGSNDKWQFPVIIDNMMNLELLLWSAQKFNNPEFEKIAVTHANTTIKNHFRKDFSSFHVVSYDTASGLAVKKNTAQGYADESAWARGQAWGLYGFTVMYRFTNDPDYLEQARKIALFIINHPNLPADKIPYWDFNAPNIPDCYRDASAGAIICSALLELSLYTTPEESNQFINVASTQLKSLSSAQYRNAPGNNGNFILKHSVGHLPANSEVDVPLIYADYYYVEALMRFRQMINQQ